MHFLRFIVRKIISGSIVEKIYYFVVGAFSIFLLFGLVNEYGFFCVMGYHSDILLLIIFGLIFALLLLKIVYSKS